MAKKKNEGLKVDVVFNGDVYVEVRERDGSKNKIPIDPKVVVELVARYVEEALENYVKSFSEKN